MAKYLKMLQAMGDASVVSLLVFFLTLIFSLPFALVVCFGRMSHDKILRSVTNVFLLIVRGTPLMLQLLVVYFGPLLLVKWLRDTFSMGITISWDRFPAAIIALSLNYAAYFAEIYRGGFDSIPVGQWEAAKVLGYTKKQTFGLIILPQVIKRIIPAMGNEIITLVKDTALVSIIGVAELLMVAKERQSSMFSFIPLLIAGVFYFVANALVAAAIRALERKLDYYR